jgi:hypothetical protein
MLLPVVSRERQIMAHSVFVSYSHVDRVAAESACATLEASGIRCWIAPRDIPAGAEWAEAIIEALDHSPVMVLIFSSSANASPQVRREVEHAVSKGVTIVPVRIEAINPAQSLAYFMAGVQWFDALAPPLEDHFRRLVASVRALLEAPANRRAATGFNTPPPRPDNVPRASAPAYMPMPDQPGLDSIGWGMLGIIAAVVVVLIIVLAASTHGGYQGSHYGGGPFHYSGGYGGGRGR